jgi:hypothetical protein
VKPVTSPTSVVVGHSTLEIPCGPDGVTVPADWYFPTGGTAPPTGLIYLNHGFFRSNDNVAALATTLAQETNSIVVAPTTSSNFVDCDGCWVNGEPMQRAVADLFVGERKALNASATAAGYDGTLPEDFVLAGHSAGGNLATAAAGYTVDNGSVAYLKAVILFDAVDNNGAMETALAKLPDDVPVLQIASPCSICNAFGSGTKALVAARPGQFVGVMMKDGTHLDAEGSNTDILAELACGIPRPRNVDAVPNIAAGWIVDAFTGSRTGVYGPAGAVIMVDKATATVLA